MTLVLPGTDAAAATVRWPTAAAVVIPSSSSSTAATTTAAATGFAVAPRMIAAAALAAANTTATGRVQRGIQRRGGAFAMLRGPGNFASEFVHGHDGLRRSIIQAS